MENIYDDLIDLQALNNANDGSTEVHDAIAALIRKIDLLDNEEQIVRETDYYTHHVDWVNACEIARDEAVCNHDYEYWEHQLKVLSDLDQKYARTMR